MNPNLGQPVKNRFKVPQRQWRKWNNLAKKIFNDMYLSMRPSMQQHFVHPDAVLAPKAHWEVTRWNAAWTAADCVRHGNYLGKVTTYKSKRAKRRGK